MPIENERKIVLRDIKPEDFDGTWTRQVLRQGYMENGNRIRWGFDTDTIARTFTAKHWVKDELVEIEVNISSDDYDKLWTITNKQLVKTRFSKKFKDELWEIDFFGDENNPYFVMAEVELPEGRLVSYTEPPELLHHILYAVEHSDNRFTSKKLTDEEYARELLSTL